MNRLLLLAAVAVLSLAGMPQLLWAALENPVPVRTVKPDYPRELHSQGVTGVVMVKCAIDSQGNVTETSVTKSSNEAFDKPAMDAVKKWKFKPARQDGNPVAIAVTIPIKFVLDES
jgi:protein TonB